MLWSHVGENFITVAIGRSFAGARKICEIDVLRLALENERVGADFVARARAGETVEGGDVRRIQKIEVVFGIIGHRGESASRVVVRVKKAAEPNLLEIVQAGDAARLLLCFGQGGH